MRYQPSFKESIQLFNELYVHLSTKLIFDCNEAGFDPNQPADGWFGLFKYLVYFQRSTTVSHPGKGYEGKWYKWPLVIYFYTLSCAGHLIRIMDWSLLRRYHLAGPACEQHEVKRCGAKGTVALNTMLFRRSFLVVCCPLLAILIGFTIDDLYDGYQKIAECDQLADDYREWEIYQQEH